MRLKTYIKVRQNTATGKITIVGASEEPRAVGLLNGDRVIGIELEIDPAVFEPVIETGAVIRVEPPSRRDVVKNLHRIESELRDAG